MLPPSEELERRRPVWGALSDLFLDTELDQGWLTTIARTLARSGYSDEELEQILYGEVFPACSCNLHSMAGEWAGIDVDWLQERILGNERKFWKKWRVFQWGRGMIEEDWRTVICLVRQHRRG